MIRKGKYGIQKEMRQSLNKRKVKTEKTEKERRREETKKRRNEEMKIDVNMTYLPF